jgi:hypothetical protein
MKTNKSESSLFRKNLLLNSKIYKQVIYQSKKAKKAKKYKINKYKSLDSGQRSVFQIQKLPNIIIQCYILIYLNDIELLSLRIVSKK